MRTIFHQLYMQVSKYCNGAFANTRIFISGREELSAVGERGNAPSVLPKRLWHDNLLEKFWLHDVY
jgi:hypothetical protein